MENLFTAKQASALADLKQQPIESILKSIESQAGYGYRFILQSYLSIEITVKLIELGYEISKFTDPMGIEQTKIKW